ncbi:hypothetical protein ACH5RR_009059 [Cinchona calisaya]|uniref:Uncharacterized protein n=1 Tax=Cinchona calisaya TaxID=153742 RepID=A0ABD3ADC9_9GENT
MRPHYVTVTADRKIVKRIIPYPNRVIVNQQDKVQLDRFMTLSPFLPSINSIDSDSDRIPVLHFPSKLFLEVFSTSNHFGINFMVGTSIGVRVEISSCGMSFSLICIHYEFPVDCTYPFLSHQLELEFKNLEMGEKGILH